MSDALARQPLFALWLACAAGASVAMWISPGEETIPFHLGWIGLVLAYDREPWRTRHALAAALGYTLLTGLILVVRAATGVIAWQETAEIPLMSGLLFLVVWNISRRQHALSRLSAVSARDRARAATRERLSRMTSHEMRTPATIARGYAELVLEREQDPTTRADVEVIRTELDRLVLASDRLVRMIRMPEQDVGTLVDVQALILDTVDRWRAIADRDWQVDAEPAQIVCSADRQRACLDTLIENSLRYTEPGATVRVLCRQVGSEVLMGVADSGPGLDARVAQLLNAGGPEPDVMRDKWHAPDPKAQTGFGMTLVRDTTVARGGRLVAGRSREGGALLLMALPVTPPAPAVARTVPVPLERSQSSSV